MRVVGEGGCCVGEVCKEGGWRRWVRVVGEGGVV